MNSRCVDELSPLMRVLAQLLVQGVVAIAQRGLRHLREQRLGIAEQQMQHRPAAIELGPAHPNSGQGKQMTQQRPCESPVCL